MGGPHRRTHRKDPTETIERSTERNNKQDSTETIEMNIERNSKQDPTETIERNHWEDPTGGPIGRTPQKP